MQSAAPHGQRHPSITHSCQPMNVSTLWNPFRWRDRMLWRRGRCSLATLFGEFDEDTAIGTDSMNGIQVAIYRANWMCCKSVCRLGWSRCFDGLLNHFGKISVWVFHFRVWFAENWFEKLVESKFKRVGDEIATVFVCKFWNLNWLRNPWGILFAAQARLFTSRERSFLHVTSVPR